MLRRFLTPRWIGLHLVTVTAVVVLCGIGWWQWDKAGGPRGSWTNYGYGVQWWLFAGFAVFLWVKLVLDELDPSRVERRTTRDDHQPPVVQRTAPPPADDEDDELAAYNRHLARLAEQEGSR